LQIKFYGTTTASNLTGAILEYLLILSYGVGS